MRLRRLIVLAMCSLVSALAFASPPAAWADPNVLFIVTDDQRLDGMVVLPKTRAWFENGGTSFSQAVVTTPACCPSRASIFTGRYAHNHGVKTNNDGPLLGTTEGAPGQRSTLQYYLKQRGYQTAIFGKYLNHWDLRSTDGDPPDPPPFFDRYSIMDDNRPHSGFTALEQGVQKTIPDYESTYIANQAVDFLTQKDPAHPWFLYISPTIPHSPFDPEPQYANAPVPASSPTASYFEQDTNDKPVWARIKSVGDMDTTEDIRLATLRMLMSVDDMVATVMQKVADLGEAENTIAFFISDNGFMLGEHGAISKGHPYLESVRVPLYMRWPGGNVPAGVSDTRLAANIDMTPTVVDALGLTTSPPMDGQSLLGSTRRNRILTEWFVLDPNQIPTWASIQTPSFIYTEYYTAAGAPLSEYLNSAGTIPSRMDDGTTTLREYYDLTSDPFQLTNLLHDGNPLDDPATAELAAMLARDRNCSGTSCPPGGGPLPLDTQITRKPEDPTGSAEATFNFTSSLPNSSFECREGDASVFDQLPYQSCTSPSTYWAGTAQQEFGVRAIGTDGTPDSTPATYTWQVDTTQPETTIKANPPLTSLSRAATFEFGSRHRSGSRIADFDCKLDGGAFSRCKSPNSYSGLGNGDHTFSVRARDDLLVDPTPASYSWYIDATPSEAVFTSTPSDPSSSGTAVFGWSQTQLTRRYECSLDDHDWTVCLPPKTYTVPDGTHTLQIRAIDIVGNVDPTPTTFTWTVTTSQGTATPAGLETMPTASSAMAILTGNNLGLPSAKSSAGPFASRTSSLLHRKRRCLRRARARRSRAARRAARSRCIALYHARAGLR